MDTLMDIDRLAASGMRFSIGVGRKGYVASMGDYLRDTTPGIETDSLEEAILWVRANGSAVPASGEKCR
jgi:hypothetical protein